MILALKLMISRKGIGIEVKKLWLCKQVKDQRNGVQVLLENENKS